MRGRASRGRLIPAMGSGLWMAGGTRAVVRLAEARRARRRIFMVLWFSMGLGKAVFFFLVVSSNCNGFFSGGGKELSRGSFFERSWCLDARARCFILSDRRKVAEMSCTVRTRAIRRLSVRAVRDRSANTSCNY